MAEEEIKLCKELELLFDHVEGRMTLKEYHAAIRELEKKREILLADAGMLADA